MESLLSAWIAEENSKAILATMLGHFQREVRETALRVVATNRLGAMPETWIPVLNERLDQAAPGDLPLLLDAIRSLPGDAFNDKVRRISRDEEHPQSLRLRALAAMKGLGMDSTTFETLAGVIGNASSSPAARIQAAQMLAAGNLGEERHMTIAPWFRHADPILLKVMTPFWRGRSSRRRRV